MKQFVRVLAMQRPLFPFEHLGSFVLLKLRLKLHF